MTKKQKKRPAIGAREIEIDGERYEIDNVLNLGNGVVQVDCGSREYIVAEDSEKAGDAAAERWREMKDHDPREFRYMIGDETLIAWACGEYAGPGSSKVRSFEDWLDVVRDHADEEWASYDGQERKVTACGADLAEEIGFAPGVAYRHN